MFDHVCLKLGGRYSSYPKVAIFRRKIDENPWHSIQMLPDIEAGVSKTCGCQSNAEGQRSFCFISLVCVYKYIYACV